MTDHDLDLLVAGATPIERDRVDAIPLHGADDALRDAIRRPAPVRRRRWVLRTAIAGAACAAALGIAAGLGIDRGGDGSGTAWAAPLVRAAETSPRLLMTGEGWRVVRADEFLPGLGEVEFSDGERTYQLNWEPTGRGPETDPTVGVADVLGTRVEIEQPPGAPAQFRAFWSSGEMHLRFRSDATTLDAFRDALGSLRRVDVDTWLRAMPASVVTPGGRARVVGEMLRGIPLPPGFDVAALGEDDGRVRDRYQLGAYVAGAVSCEWIGRWIAAREAGDRAAVTAAVEAMATSTRWPILREMDAEGDFPEVLWDLAAAMPGNAAIPAGRPMTVAEGYGSALGCDAG